VDDYLIFAAGVMHTGAIGFFIISAMLYDFVEGI
jgi:hypothetical protein